MRRTLKALALLVGGTLLGLLTTLALEDPVRICLTVVVGLGGALLALYGLSLVDIAYHVLVRARRNTRARTKRQVGILFDSDETKPWCSKGVWTDITPDQWKHYIRDANGAAGNAKPRLSPKMAALSGGTEMYNVLLNPYGGAYPEEDTIARTNLDRIFEYVSAGGIFVNVADLPGYWMYHVALRTLVDATPTTYGVLQQNGRVRLLPIRPFERTPFAERLAVRVEDSSGYITRPGVVYNCPHNEFTLAEIPKRSAERLAVVERNVSPIIVVRIPNRKEDLTPLFVVPYGRGKFVVCLYFLVAKYPQNEVLPQKLVTMLKNL